MIPTPNAFFTTLLHFTLHHKIHPFQVYNSMIFSKFTEWGSHLNKSVLEYFHNLIKIPDVYLH